MSSGESIGIDFDSAPEMVIEAMKVAKRLCITYSEALDYLKAKNF